MSHANFTIALQPDELALVDAIEFDPLTLNGDHRAYLENAERAFQLSASLLERQGIPDHRQRYFTDPDYYPGGRGRSRMGNFERNGTSGDDILRPLISYDFSAISSTAPICPTRCFRLFDPQ